MSDALVEEVRARTDLVEICGEFTTLKRMGRSYRGACPLHGGEGANFAVDPDRGIFKCFVCGEGGDAFAFLMKRLGLDFPTAVRHVAGRVGIEIPDREARREDPYRHLRETAAFAAEWFAAQLWSEAGTDVRAYLEQRGIEEESARSFGLGFAPEEWRALRSAATERGIEERHLLELGLLATSERADEPYDRFRGRLMFTIRDARDRVIGFGGRTLGRSEANVPKYINSPESPIFHKSETLYGLNWARHEIRREGHAAVVEGYTDVLALHNGGMPIAVAGLGTAFTPRQAEALGRYTSKAYLLYDSDDAGLRATFRTADVLLAAGIHPLVVTLPEGEDPDSMIRSRGPEAIHRCFADAVDALERKLQILDRNGYLADVEGRRRAIDGLLSTLRAVKDPALRDIYLDRSVERTGVRRETLVHEVAARRATSAGPRRESVGPGAPGRASRDTGEEPLDALERNLALLLVRDPELVRRAGQVGATPEHFRNSGVRRIFSALLAALEDSAPGEEEAWNWSSRLDGSTAALAEALIRDETELMDPTDIFEDSLVQLLHRPALDRLSEIDRELELAEEAQARKLLIEKQSLAEQLRAAGIPLGFVRSRRARQSAG